MEIKLNTLNITRAQIEQMELLLLTLCDKKDDIEVICWVNIDDQRVVIVKQGNKYMRAHYVTAIHPIGYHPRYNYKIFGTCFSGLKNDVIHRDENGNESKLQELFNFYTSYKAKTDEIGQYYYL
jgi:hypothetical protein